MVAHRESATVAERFIHETCTRQGVGRAQLTIHADRGSAMTSRVSYDNPFSEAQSRRCEKRLVEARARVNEVFRRLTTLKPAALGAEELTPEELPFLRCDAAAQECFDASRGDLEQTLRAEAEHPVWGSHVAKYRSLMPSLALIGHLIDAVDGGRPGRVRTARLRGRWGGVSTCRGMRGASTRA
jgi:hypothetical protein